jgi:hypothetical protein
MTNEELFEKWNEGQRVWKLRYIDIFVAACRLKDLDLKRANVRIADKQGQIERMRSTVERLENIEQQKLQLEIQVIALKEELTKKKNENTTN